MPLTAFQEELGRLLAANRSEDSYLAGGAAILLDPRSRRFSRDLDYFQDTAERVASAFAADRDRLIGAGCELATEISQPGYIRAVVRRGGEATKIEWAQDSTWRFMPVIRSEIFGYQLHPIDLATNKVLALAGRDEARDLVDTLYLHDTLLELGALVWAASGKDPGYSPRSLLEMLQRRGRVRPEELARLDLTREVDVSAIKDQWLSALMEAREFVAARPPEEAGCLYYSPSRQAFVVPADGSASDAVPHFGRPGGVLPRFAED